jgi:hypothetical protein
MRRRDRTPGLRTGAIANYNQDFNPWPLFSSISQIYLTLSCEKYTPSRARLEIGLLAFEMENCTQQFARDVDSTDNPPKVEGSLTPII